MKNNHDGTYSVSVGPRNWGIVNSAGQEVVSCNYPTREKARERFYDSKVQSKFTGDDIYDKRSPKEKKDKIKSDKKTGEFNRDYSQQIKRYVEREINAWQKKEEFEKTVDYQRRVTESSRKKKIEELTKEICEKCLSEIKEKKLKMTLGEYDADNETFLIKTEIGDIVVPVEISIAPRFKAEWAKISSKNTYDIVNGKVILRSAIFSLKNNNLAVYNNSEQAQYAQTSIHYNFDPIEIPELEAGPIANWQPAKREIQVGKSDVDVDIPEQKNRKNNTFAVVFANEEYREEVPVSFAMNDGRTISKYFISTLGIPSSNIHLVENATKNDMVRELDWLKQVSKVYENIEVIVYYAGHGCPDESSSTAYLIPVDGSSNNSRTLFSVADFYRELGEVKSEKKILFMDACFSGARRGAGMLASARGIALKPKIDNPFNQMVVISASQGDETAWPYEEKGHGLFTYFLLKKLKQTKGNITLGQLSDYIISEVGRHSIIVNSKKQTPAVVVSPDLVNDWSVFKLN